MTETASECTRIIVADIGGTNSRFALLEGNPLKLVTQKTVSTDVPGFEDVLRALENSSPAFFTRKADCVVVAVAGAVNSQESIRLTNRQYSISKEQLQVLSEHILFINDFEAQAWSTVTDLMQRVQPVIASEENSQFNDEALRKGVLLIGPGTGLGVAYCRLVKDKLLILPTEGGHVSLPFKASEREYEAFLIQMLNRSTIEYEDTVCGRGLERINLFFNKTHLSAPQITASEDFCESQTCTLFARFLARAARNMSLSVLPRGGILITGGIAAKCPEIVHSEAFREEFLDMRPPFDAIIHSIPVWLNRDESSGLWGAVAAARQFLSKQ